MESIYFVNHSKNKLSFEELNKQNVQLAQTDYNGTNLIIILMELHIRSSKIYN